MSGPWEDYQSPGSGGPWEDYNPPEQKSVAGFVKNLGSDIVSNVKGAVNFVGSGGYPGALVRMLKSPKGAVEFAQGQASIPGQIASEVKHPVESLYKKPFSTGMDALTLAEGGMAAADAARPLVRGVAERAAPGLIKATAGVPESMTRRAIENPAIFDKPPVPSEQINQAVGQPFIDSIKAAKQATHERISPIYRKYAGMEGPMQEVLDTPIAQKVNFQTKEVPTTTTIKEPDKFVGGFTEKQVPGEPKKVTTSKPGDMITVPRKVHSYDDIVVNRQLAKLAFEKGDNAALNTLYKEYVGTPKSDISALGVNDKDKLQILTRLKREIQKETDYNKAPVTLAPIDSAKDAALKSMANEIDSLRSNSGIKGAKQLDAADNAWKNVSDIVDTIHRDLSDPGKAKDTIMRLAKGDNSWLTSGRMKGKVDAIKKAELLTGKSVLQPALDELTRQVFNEWSGKGFVSQVLQGGAGAGSVLAATAHNPMALPLAAVSAGMTSPRVIRGAIRGAAGAGEMIGNASESMRSPALMNAFRNWIDSVKNKDSGNQP